jgi:hypothetical protein
METMAGTLILIYPGHCAICTYSRNLLLSAPHDLSPQGTLTIKTSTGNH